MNATLKRAGLCFAVSVGLAGVLSLAWWLTIVKGAAAAKDVVIDIPAGTAAAIESGAAASPLPSNLTLGTRSRLVVRNHDAVPHRIGALAIEPGGEASISAATLSYTPSNRFVCSFHPAGAIDFGFAGEASLASMILPALIMAAPLGSVFFGIVTVLSRLQVS